MALKEEALFSTANGARYFYQCAQDDDWQSSACQLMHQYLGGLLDPFVTLLEAHKLMYFLQVSGEPLRLKFQKAPYGPYAEPAACTEGNQWTPDLGLRRYGDSPGKQLELVPGAVKDATAFLDGQPKTKQRLERVAQLIEGFESSFGLELLSTVHWVAVERPTATKEEVDAWGVNKRQFSKRQIGIAHRFSGREAGSRKSNADDHRHQRRRPPSPECWALAPERRSWASRWACRIARRLSAHRAPAQAFAYSYLKAITSPR